MHTDAVIAGELRGAGRAEDAILLRAGAGVVARVASLTPDGRGVLAFAGALVRARLPAGVREGDRLALTVLGRSGSEIALQLRADAPGAGSAPIAPPLLTPPGELPAPLRRFLAEVDPEADGGETSGRGSCGEAAFVLRSPVLGPIEVRLRLAPGGIRAAVLVEPGEPAGRAGAAAPALGSALAAAAARPASVRIAARPFEAHV